MALPNKKIIKLPPRGLVKQQGPHGYDLSSMAYFNVLTTPLTISRKVAINNLVLQLKDSGDWNKFDRLWIHAAETQDQARVSLVNPTSAQITEVSSPSWMPNQGYTGNGSSSYLNTNFTPSTDAVNYTQNNACMGLYTRTNISSATNVEMGGFDAGNAHGNYLEIWVSGSNVTLGNINSAIASGANGPITDSLALHTIARTGPTNHQLYKRGVAVGTTQLTTPSTGLSTVKQYILCYNANGTPTNLSTHQVAVSFFSSGGINQLSVYNAIQQFLTSFGAQV